MHERLQAAVGTKTYRQIAELTGTNHESVRRYLSGAAPSADFLASLCRTLRINADWLLTGRGPMRADEVRTAALRESPAPDLLNAMAASIERLLDRVDRIEAYVQTMETRVRATHTGNLHGTSSAAPERARRIGEVITKRPPAHDRGAAPPGRP
jgi:transcriptional regulator with XRE-family HTH domain